MHADYAQTVNTDRTFAARMASTKERKRYLTSRESQMFDLLKQKYQHAPASRREAMKVEWQKIIDAHAMTKAKKND